jgi:hypothetical protein
MPRFRTAHASETVPERHLSSEVVGTLGAAQVFSGVTRPRTRFSDVERSAMGHRWKLLLAVSAGATAVVPSELGASPSADGQTGATSSGRVSIIASVAPRMGYRGQASLRPDRKTVGFAALSLCIWSSTPLRRYSLTIESEGEDEFSLANGRGHRSAKSLAWNAGRDSGRTSLVAGVPVEGKALGSADACSDIKSAGSLIMKIPRARFPATDGQPYRGSVLLIIAPQ